MNKQDFEEVKKRFESDTKRRKNISLLLNYLSIIVAGITLSLFISKYFVSDYSTDFVNKASTAFNINELKKENLNLKEELKKQKAITDSIIRSTENTANNVTPSKILSLEKEIQTLNKVILETPEKAVSIPLMKSDIEHLKEQNLNDVKILREEIAKAYDTNKWIIGLVSTMLVSIIALNISNLLAKKKD